MLSFSKFGNEKDQNAIIDAKGKAGGQVVEFGVVDADGDFRYHVDTNCVADIEEMTSSAIKEHVSLLGSHNQNAQIISR